MPYSGTSDPKLPDYVKELDESARKQWVSTFNRVMSETGDEGRAFATASSAIKSSAEESAWLETLNTLAPDKLSLIERFVKWFNGESKQLNTFGFKVVGDNQWVAWYTNAYQDKDYEFFPQQAINHDIHYMAENEAYPELWFYHIPGTAHGKATWAGMVGKLAVAVGEFYDTPTAEAFKAYYRKNKMELSHGFIYDAAQKRNGVFWNYHTYEISTLPPGKAANPYTAFDVKEQSMPQMNADQFKALSDVLGMEAALQVVQDGTAREKALQAANVAYKAETPVTVSATNTGTTITTTASIPQLSLTDDGKAVTLEIEAETPESPMGETEDAAYTMKALCEKVDMLTGAMTKMLELMATKAVQPEPEVKATPPALSNERSAAIIQDLLANQQKAVDDRHSVFDITQLVFGGE